MNLYKPSTLKSLLKETGAKPKKSFSQNFLIDQNILKKIVKHAEVRPNDMIIEIGPGPGALTEMLLKQGARVIAIEKDKKFAARLEELKKIYSNLTVYAEDILDCEIEELVDEPCKVVSNLPYHLTTPIISSLIQKSQVISSLTIMVQKEVGLRMMAERRSKDYSSFSLFCQHYADVSYLFTIKPNSFFPKPKVFSCLMQLKLKTSPSHFPSELIRKAFQQKRKMLRSSLGELYGSQVVTNVLEDLNIREDARPQDLSLTDFINFAANINPTRMPSNV